MMTGKEDEMPQIVREVQVEVFNRVKSEKQYYEIDGGHFGAIYPHTPLFYEAIAVQSAFIKSITWFSSIPSIFEGVVLTQTSFAFGSDW